MAPSDQEILALIASGDVAAFADLYDRYAARLFGLVAKIVGRTADAEDILQEVFWQVWCGASKYDPRRGEPAAWLVMIARSRACDASRRRQRPSDGVAAKDGIDKSDPASLLEQSESCRNIMRALERLPADQLSAIQSAFYGGMTHVEIARQQQIPLGTVKTRIRSGIRQLRDLLSDQEHEKAQRT